MLYYCVSLQGISFLQTNGRLLLLADRLSDLERGWYTGGPAEPAAQEDSRPGGRRHDGTSQPA